MAISALQSTQAKLQSENNELNAQLSEAEHRNGTLSKTNTNLTAQLDEAKSELEMESTVSNVCCVKCDDTDDFIQHMSYSTYDNIKSCAHRASLRRSRS